MPRPRNEEDAQKVFALAKSLASKSAEPVELNEKYIKELAFQARGDLAPMNAFLGGLVAQEVLKVRSRLCYESILIPRHVVVNFIPLFNICTLILWSRYPLNFQQKQTVDR